MLLGAMNYCILRAAKLRTFGSIAGSAKHTFREIDTPNADPSRTHLNVTFGAKSSKAICAAIKSRLPEKRRKDAVLCIEYLVTASPEWFKTATVKQQNDYFRAATKWMQDRHGKENIVCLNVQNDETSPHMVVYVVPKTKDGRLSAKDFLGGRAKLSQMQTDFYKAVGEPVGLQRGVEGSKAKHTTAKQYSAILKKNPTLQPPVKPAPSIMDRVTGKAKAAEDKHEAEMAEYAAQVEKARNVALLNERARKAQAEAIEDVRKRLAELEEVSAEVEEIRQENKKLRTKVQREKDEYYALMKILQDLINLLLSVVGLSVSWEKRAEAAEGAILDMQRQMDRKAPAKAKPDT